MEGDEFFFSLKHYVNLPYKRTFPFGDFLTEKEYPSRFEDVGLRPLFESEA